MNSIVLNSFRYYYSSNKNVPLLRNQNIFRFLFETFLLLILFRLAYALIILAFDYIFKTDLQNVKMSTMDSFINGIGKLRYWILAGLIGPIYEELMFRAPLNNSKKTLITSSLALFFFTFF